MKFLSKCFLVFLLTLSVYSEVRADYIIAGDLSYECKGDLVYDVKLVVYTECLNESGVNMDQVSDYVISIQSKKLNVGVGSENVTFKVRKNSITDGEEINLYCETEKTNCAGSGNLQDYKRGVKKYTYTGRVDLKKHGGASTDWKFFWAKTSRTDEIPTLKDADLDPYYVEAYLNNKDFGCNSSPQFGTNAVLKSYTNEVNDIDLLTKDPDGDELRYKIVAPQAFDDIYLEYATGASLNNPLGDGTSFSISNTGHLVFNPKEKDKLGLFDLEISEYRNGKKVGSVTRGIQVNTYESINEAPIVEGFNNTNEFSAAFCVGSPIERGELTFKVYDPDGNDINTSLEVKASNRLIRPSYKEQIGDTVVFQFVWPPFSASYIGKHEMIITATDKACPTPKSTSATFTIEVRDIPKVSLPDNQTIPCVPNTIIEANLEKGNPASVSYLWATWDTARSNLPPNDYEKIFTDDLSKTTKTLDTNIPDRYAVKAIDDAGCVSEYATIKLFGSYFPEMNIIPYCKGDITRFTNQTQLYDTENKKHEFTTFTWSFGDGNSADTENTTHQYSSLGTYVVNFNFKTNYGCDVNQKEIITVCARPKPSFIKQDSCLNSTVFNETTNYLPDSICEPSAKLWYINGDIVLDRFGNALNSPTLNIPEDTLLTAAGEYDITFEVIMKAGCAVDTTMKININPIPKLEIVENGLGLPDFFLNCANPDTTLKATVLDSAAGGLTFEWFRNDTLNPLFTDTLFVTDTTGNYKISATDIKGCQNDTSVTIFYPSSADFVYDTVCSLGNPVVFTDQSTTSTTKIESWEWDFGDGTTSIEQNPTHVYPESKDYSAILKITDSVQCESFDTIVVYNTFLKNVYRIEPDTIAKPICAENDIQGYSVEIIGDTSHINEIYWNLGNGRNYLFYNNEDGDTLATDGQIIDFSYEKDDEFILESYTKFNAHPEIHSNYCIYTYKDTVKILPEFDGKIIDFKNCVTDTSLFYFVRETGDLNVGVKSYKWLVADNNSIDDSDPFKPIVGDPSKIIFQSTDSTVQYYLGEQKAIDIYLVAIDTNNCESVIRADAQIKDQSKIWLTIRDTCAGLPTIIDPHSKLEKNSDRFGITRYNGDTLAYDFMVPFPDNRVIPSPKELYFNETGKIPLKVFVEYIADNNTHCRYVVDTSVYIDPVPHVDFEWDTVCAVDQFVTFKDLSTPPPGETIRNWYWDFGDTTSSTLQNPTHTYKSGGFYTVSLTVETDKCPATYTQKIYVRHKPKANFYFGVDFPEAFEPLPFEDSSMTIVGNYIDKQYYNFKDGTDTTIQGFEQVVEHTYNEIKVYFVDYQITNNEGCSDTITKRTDLNVYLELPTAFTPNGDGNNDELGLIYKSIVELYDFKIFNRWGEIVFDAQGDLDKPWDGTFKGKLQEAGVYVVHVQALGAYDTKFNFKQNITLLR